MSNLNVFDSIVCGLPRYLAGLSAFIDIRRIKYIVIAYPDRERISPRPANLAAINADGDIRLRLGVLQLVDQHVNFGDISVLAATDGRQRIENN